MAVWWRAVNLEMTDEEMSLPRTEPASRASRAQMLLAYRATPSFFAVRQSLGVAKETKPWPSPALCLAAVGHRVPLTRHRRAPARCAV
jgi:hypothetical protein